MTRAALGLALCWVCACGGSGSAPTATVQNQASTALQNATKSPAPVSAEKPPAQDAAGNLLASGDRVAWLELPRGLTSYPTGRTVEHLFKARGIPMDRIQAFFGARLAPSSTRRQGADGIVMAGCVPPSGPQPKQTLIDVSVLRGSAPDEVLVYIYERPYVPVRPDFTEADARALLNQQRKRAE